jgi:hypothetical protein
VSDLVHPSKSQSLAVVLREQKQQSLFAIFQDDSLSFQTSSEPSEHLKTLNNSSIDIWREGTTSHSFAGLGKVAGFDISFRDSNGDEGVAVLAVLSFPDLKVNLIFLSRLSKVC